MKSWVVAAAVAIGVTAAMALDRADGEPAPQAGAAAGQMIFIDPATGEILQPTVEEWSQLPRPIAPKAKKILERVLPDGSIEIPAEALHFEVKATVAADGSLQFHCDDQPDEPR